MDESKVVYEIEDSVDAKIDDFFVEFESNALSNIETQSENFFRRLYEKDNEENDEEETEDESDVEEDDEEKEKGEELDVDSFASDMNRLLKNYSSLIDFKNIILKRSISFLKKNYTDEVVDSFVQVMESEYSLAVGKTKKDFEEKYQAPHADRAGGGGSGGGGI